MTANRLDPSSVVEFLLLQGLLDGASIVSEEVIVQHVPRRNHNFQIFRKSAPSYFVKQGVDPDTRATLENEARVYRALASDDHAKTITRYLPRFVDFDADRCVLVLELIANARSLSEQLSTSKPFSRVVARDLGNALAALHRLPPPSLFAEDHTVIPSAVQFPAISLNFLQNLSAASIELLKTAQAFQGYRDLLPPLADQWNGTAFIHADIRGSNCLARSSSKRETGRARLVLVDWELASIGDARWDVGSVFADYLVSWVSSIPIAPDISVARLPMLARYPLSQIQPAIREFWNAYSRRAEFSKSERIENLVGSVMFAAARLAQTAFEHAQGSMFLGGGEICLLQLSWNMLKRPTEAIVWLLGIEIPDVRASI